jgi:predicted RNase H-like nuclease (RuvC/YqgF family)
MNNPIIETDLAEILGQINQKLDKLSEEVTELKTEVKVGFAEVKGEIKALDAQVEQLDKRITNSEFTNRGIFIGIVVIVLGGAAKFFGLVAN